MADGEGHEGWLCGEVGVTSIGGEAYLQRAWSPVEGREMLRLGREAAGVTPPAEAQLISEAELLGLIDQAWDAGLLSDFFKRQLFHQVMRRYEEAPEALWAAGPAFELDD